MYGIKSYVVLAAFLLFIGSGKDNPNNYSKYEHRGVVWAWRRLRVAFVILYTRYTISTCNMVKIWYLNTNGFRFQRNKDKKSIHCNN